MCVRIRVVVIGMVKMRINVLFFRKEGMSLRDSVEFKFIGFGN